MSRDFRNYSSHLNRNSIRNFYSRLSDSVGICYNLRDSCSWSLHLGHPIFLNNRCSDLSTVNNVTDNKVCSFDLFFYEDFAAFYLHLHLNKRNISKNMEIAKIVTLVHLNVLKYLLICEKIR